MSTETNDQVEAALDRMYEEFYAALFHHLDDKEARKQAAFLTTMVITRWLREWFPKA